MKSRVAAPVSTNFRQLTSKPAREELSDICACTVPVGTGFGTMYLECDGKTWQKRIDSHKHTHTNSLEKAIHGTLPSNAIRYEEGFFRWKTKKKWFTLRPSRESFLSHSVVVFAAIKGPIAPFCLTFLLPALWRTFAVVHRVDITIRFAPTQQKQLESTRSAFATSVEHVNREVQYSSCSRDAGDVAPW